MPRKKPSNLVREAFLDTLRFLMTNAEFRSLSDAKYPGMIPDQSGEVSRTYSKLKKSDEDNWESQVPSLDIPIIKIDDKDIAKAAELMSQRPTVLIGGIVKANDGQIIYSSLSVCITFTTDSPTPNISHTGLNCDSCCLPGCATVKRIVRRFHFDYQPTDTHVPRSHIQYGGHFYEDNSHTSNWHYCLGNSLKMPRIHYPPMDMVLVCDMIFRQFNTPLTKLTQEPAWINLVLNSQMLCWKGYWKFIEHHIKNTSPTVHQKIYT